MDTVVVGNNAYVLHATLRNVGPHYEERTQQSLTEYILRSTTHFLSSFVNWMYPASRLFNSYKNLQKFSTCSCKNRIPFDNGDNLLNILK